jgi:hypothetical protein
MPDDKVRVSRVKKSPVRSKWQKKVKKKWRLIADAPTNRLTKVRIEWKKDGIRQKMVLAWDDEYRITFIGP